MDWCKYKYALGVPNQGLHKHIFGFAIFDLILTIIIAFIIMLFTKKYFDNISHSLLFGILLLIILIIAEYIHHKVCLI
jgi:hypothetical protein